MSSNNDIVFSWPLIGNRQVTGHLEKSIIKGNIGGTYIFHGPEDLGKATLARHFAQILLCRETGNLPCGGCPSCTRFKPAALGLDDGAVHGDLHILKKENGKKFISVEQTRNFIRKLSMSSFMNSYKIGIIKKAETLNREAANALLKTLEEPREKVLVILSVSDFAALPATIISRAQVFNFYPVKTGIIFDYLMSELQAKRSEAGSASRLSLGRPALAAKFVQDKEFLKEYEKIVNVFLNFIDKDIKSRFSAIESLLDEKEKGQEAVYRTAKILSVWQGALRDLLLAHYGFNDLLQNHAKIELINEIKQRFGLADIIRMNKALKEAKINLSANVNPKLVLEEVAVGIA
jgi:DNA polymerase III subunit delta'